MKDYLLIITKEGPIEETIDLSNLISRKVISAKGFVVGKVKRVRLNNKLVLEGVFVSRGLYKKSLFIGASYFDKLSEKAIILKIDPFVLLKGFKIITNDGEFVGKIKDFIRKNNSNDLSGIVVKKRFWKDYSVDITNIKSFGSSIILKESYNVPKKYFWKGS